MAISAGIIIINQCVSSSISSSGKRLKINSHKKINRFRVNNCMNHDDVASDPYKILRIHTGASESQVKKAFRELALKYHPDVCKGSDCGVQFQQINAAYDKVMDDLRDERIVAGMQDEPLDEMMRSSEGPDFEDMWEEWMGWEGAGIRDYSSHINPCI